MYWLTITFFVIAGQGSGIGATTIPTSMTYEECVQAGQETVRDYPGGAKVEFVCTKTRLK